VTTLLETHKHITPEVIIVSDGDGEEIMQELKVFALDVDVNLIRIDRRGFAAACNAGMRAANGELAVYLINNDIVFETNCLQVMTDAMLKMNAGVVGCLLLYPDRTIQHAGVVYVPAANKDSPVPGYFDHALRFQEEKYIDAVVMNNGLITGALFGISRAMIERSGYLDERFKFTCEDIDMDLRAYECGMPPLYVGYTWAIHLEGASRGRTLEEKMALEPEIAKRELESLAFLHRKYVGLDLGRFSIGSAL